MVDRASHEATWAAAEAPQYVAYRTSVAGLQRAYDTADINAGRAWETALATAGYNRDVADAAAEYAKETAVAAAGKAYADGVAPVERTRAAAVAAAYLFYDLAVADAQHDYDTADVPDMNAYNAAVSAAAGVRDAAVKTAEKAYDTDAIQVEKTRLIAQAGAERDASVAFATSDETWLIAAADATKTAALADAAAVHDRDLALLNTDTGYQSDSAARYADEMLALAQGSDTPWGWEHYAEAAAAAEYASSMAAAALTDGTTTIDESYTFAQTEADETRTLSVNEAAAAFNSATALAAAEYNHVTSHATALADDNYHIAERVPTAVITLVGLDNLEGRAAGDPADFIAALNKNGGSPFSDLGDSFYTAAVDKMFYTPPETDELGYSNSFDRWLGENLIRPAIGDDNLINATDAQLFWGTAAFAAISAVTIVYATPVLATAVVDMGIKGVAFTLAKDFIIGGAISGIIDAGVQLEHMYENGGDFNWSRLGESIVVGGVMGMGMGTAFRGVQTLSKALTTRYAAACGRSPSPKSWGSPT